MLKTNIKLEKLRQNTQRLNVIRCSLSDEKPLNEIHQEKGPSIWLTTFPLKDEGYCLNRVLGFSEVEVWLAIITATYPMHLWSSIWCTPGGFITLRHNHIRNVTAELLSEVTKDVKIDPVLQSLTGETFEQRIANTSNDARLDISGKRFWTKYQMAFFDVMPRGI